jgi:hypothetical protein
MQTKKGRVDRHRNTPVLLLAGGGIANAFACVAELAGAAVDLFSPHRAVA